MIRNRKLNINQKQLLYNKPEWEELWERFYIESLYQLILEYSNNMLISFGF